MITIKWPKSNGYACQSGIVQTSHEFFCEEGIPYPRGHLQNILVGMCLNALQDINQVDAWIDLMHATTGQQGLNDSQSLRAHFGSAKHPVFAPHRDGAQSSFQLIGIQCQQGVIEEVHQARSSCKPIVQCLAQRFFGQQVGASTLFVNPCKEGFHDRSTLLLSPDPYITLLLFAKTFLMIQRADKVQGMRKRSE